MNIKRNSLLLFLILIHSCAFPMFARLGNNVRQSLRKSLGVRLLAEKNITAPVAKLAQQKKQPMVMRPADRTYICFGLKRFMIEQKNNQNG